MAKNLFLATNQGRQIELGPAKRFRADLDATAAPLILCVHPRCRSKALAT
jgi:hypothetical protein